MINFFIIFFLTINVPFTLSKGCKLEKEWIGIYPDNLERLQLKCGKNVFNILHPLNLSGYVKIETSEDALNYVRFFSNLDNYHLFYMNGMVEVVYGKEGKDDICEKFYCVDEEEYNNASIFKPKVIVEFENRQKNFMVERYVVKINRKIYKIREWVKPNGEYYITNEEVIIEESMDIGIMHFGNI